MAMNQHPYQSCRDRDCGRPYCLIWREARQEGYDDGYRDGYADGAASAARGGRSGSRGGPSAASQSTGLDGHGSG